MKMRTIIMYCFLAVFTLASCEVETDWPIEDVEFETLVVDAIVTNEYKTQEVKLSKPSSSANKGFMPVSRASVNIGSEAFTVHFFESETNKGLYESEIPFAAVIDREYKLTVQYEGKLYYATSYLVPVLPFTRLQTAPVESQSGLYEIKWIAAEYAPQEQAMYEVVIDWSHLPVYSHPDSINMARILHYTLNTIDVSYNIFPQDREDVVFPQGSVITEKKYSLNDEYAMYLRALLAETEWQGSLFEDARGNLPTNISNGGLGYFSVCAVLSDTIAVQ